MKSRTKKIIVGIAVLMFLISAAIVLSFVSLLLSLADTEPQPGSFTHEVSYEFDVETNSTLRNVSFLVPFPQNQEFVEGFPNISENTTFSNEFNGTVELVEVNGTQMLELKINELRPRRTSNQVTIPAELSYEKRYNRSLNTSHGLEQEPAIPVENRSEYFRDSCDSRKCFSSTTEVYADYQTENDTAVFIRLVLDGWNQWFTTAWSGNEYRQYFSTGYYNGVHLNGSQSNWVLIEGEEVQGDGIYRD